MDQPVAAGESAAQLPNGYRVVILEDNITGLQQKNRANLTPEELEALINNAYEDHVEKFIRLIRENPNKECIGNRIKIMKSIWFSINPNSTTAALHEQVAEQNLHIKDLRSQLSECYKTINNLNSSAISKEKEHSRNINQLKCEHNKIEKSLNQQIRILENQLKSLNSTSDNETRVTVSIPKENIGKFYACVGKMHEKQSPITTTTGHVKHLKDLAKLTHSPTAQRRLAAEIEASINKLTDTMGATEFENASATESLDSDISCEKTYKQLKHHGNVPVKTIERVQQHSRKINHYKLSKCKQQNLHNIHIVASQPPMSQLVEIYAHDTNDVIYHNNKIVVFYNRDDAEFEETINKFDTTFKDLYIKRYNQAYRHIILRLSHIFNIHIQEYRKEPHTKATIINYLKDGSIVDTDELYIFVNNIIPDGYPRPLNNDDTPLLNIDKQPHNSRVPARMCPKQVKPTISKSDDPPIVVDMEKAQRIARANAARTPLTAPPPLKKYLDDLLRFN